MNDVSLPGLIVPIEARVDKLEKSLQRANRMQRRASGQMEQRAELSAKRMQASYGKAGNSIAASFGKLGPALLAGISVGAINAVGQRIGRVVNEVAKIGDAAKTAGVNIEAFQELSFVSKANRISVDAMTDGLKELQLRADEFIATGGGAGADAFARLGYSAAQLTQGLKEPDRLFEDIIGKLEKLDDAARIRVSDEIFGGTAAEQFAGMIARGADALRDTRREARETGQVLDRDVIQKAEELDRRFAALTTRVGNFGKAFAVGLADASVKLVTLRTEIDDLTGTLERAESLLGEGIADTLATDQAALDENAKAVALIVAEYHRLGEAADQLTGPLFQSASHLAMIGEADASIELARIATEMNELVGKLNTGSISAETFEERIEELTGAAQSALAEVSAIDGVQFTAVTTALSGFVGMMQTAIARARDLRSALPGANPDGTADPSVNNPDANDPRGNFWGGSGLPKPTSAPAASNRPQLPSVDADFGSPAPSGAGDRSGGAGGSSRQSAYEREIAAIAEMTTELQLETQELERLTGTQLRNADAMELARTKAELLAAAQRSGLADTPVLRGQIDTIADAYVRASRGAEMAAGKIAEVQQASREGATSVASVFGQMATGAISAKDAVRQLILQVIQLTIKKRILAAVEAMSGMGGLGGLLGGVLGAIGGGFANGGYTGDGGKHQPAGVVHKGEYVMPKAVVQRVGVDRLAGLHSAALRGYADGGLVGERAGLQLGAQGGSEASNPMVVNAPITINGSAGTPAQNDDLAKKMAREMEGTMRGIACDEMRRQKRPGNMLSRR